MSSDNPKEWFKWLPLAEFWYNTNFHSSTKTTPFQVLYGQQPPTHIPYLLGLSCVAAVDRSLTARECMIHKLKHHLHAAKHRMKQLADKKRIDREFAVGDWVYVKLQPYRQHSLKAHHCHKLSPKYFGPFEIVARIGAVAYQLLLPPEAKIHHTFHVSLLKQKIGDHPVIPHLPTEVNDFGQILMEPVAVLDRRMVKRGNVAATQVLVQWSNGFPEDATWVYWQDLAKKFPHFDP